MANGFLFSTESLGWHRTDDQFVEVLYKLYLDRDSDASGKTYWLNELSNGKTRQQVSDGFAQSEEFTNLLKTYGIN